MRPLRLALQAFGPYSGRQEIDFRKALGSGLFGVYGSTGSGKSTIFSAMTFALFGEAAKFEQHATTLRSDHAEVDVLTAVELIFELGDKQYRIERWPEQIRPAKRGGGETKEAHKARLFDVTGMTLETIDDRNPGKVIVEGRVTDVTARVEELLGYGATQFRQIVLLPQGRFEVFLAAKTEERLAILRDLFDVSLYRRLTESVKEGAKTAEAKFKTDRTVCEERLRAEGFESVELLVEGIASAEAKHVELVQAVAIEKARCDVAEEIYRKAALTDLAFEEHVAAEALLRKIENEREAVDAIRRRLNGARIAESLSDVAAAAEAAKREAEVARGDFERAIAKCADAKKASEAATGRLRVLVERRDEIESLRTRLRTYVSHSETLTESQGLLRVMIEADEQAQASGDAWQKAVSNHDELVARHRAAVERLDSARIADAARSALELNAAKAEAALNEARAFEDFEARLAKSREDLAGADERRVRASVNFTRTEGIYRSAEATLLQDHASHLAAKLVAGEACPVCGSHDHPSPARGAAGGSAQDGAFETAKRAFEAAATELSGLQARCESVRDRYAELQSEFAARLKPELTAVELKSDLDRVREKIAGLGPPANISALTELCASLAGDISEAIPNVRVLQERASSLKTTAAMKRQSLDDALKSIPENLREAEALLLASEHLKGEIAAYDGALRDAQEVERETRDALVGATRDEQNAARNRDTAEIRFKAATDAFHARLSGCQLTLEQFEVSKSDVAGIADFERQITLHGEKRAVAESRLHKARDAIKDLERPDIAALKDARDAVRKLHEAANDKASLARGRIEHLVKLRSSIAAEVTRLEQMERDTAPLRELARVFSGQTDAKVDLETFAIMTMFDRVLEAANLRYGPMSRGRYRLLRETEGRGGARRGLGICVEDAHTGRPRSTSTLSGGETFIAALALALGLSDVIESTRGNIRLDTIFIDEGFGSLDSDNEAGTLEQVLQTLQTLVATNRAVGLISHVPLVQQAIPNGFWIRSSPSGSFIEERS